ncbi:hypothetical protein AB0K12_26685 [Nonomuraea sp. NPDC049419]
MSFVLDLQVKSVSEGKAADGPEPQSLSFFSPVTCFSTTSVVLC